MQKKNTVEATFFNIVPISKNKIIFDTDFGNFLSPW